MYEEGGIVRFEYSLKVLYDWEGKWKKPFLKGNLTDEEIIDFYRMMALDPIDIQFITEDVMQTLAEYVSDTHTATTFTSLPDGQNGNNSFSKSKVYTAEQLYALMFINHVPLEFESRNLNRLLTVLRVIGNYNTPPKKMTKQEIFKQNAELNRQRKEQLKTKG